MIKSSKTNSCCTICTCSDWKDAQGDNIVDGNISSTVMELESVTVDSVSEVYKIMDSIEW